MARLAAIILVIGASLTGIRGGLTAAR